MKERLHWSVFLVAANLVSTAFTYTAYDDASWAIVSKDISNIFGNGPKETYQRFMANCNALDPKCQSLEDYRLFRNKYQPQSVYNYTDVGFKKVRAPAAVMKLINDFWKANKNNLVKEMDAIDPYHNHWDAPTSIAHIYFDKFVGGGRELPAAIAQAARELMEEWTGMRLMSTSVYGVRVYHEGSILTPHVDRIRLVSSCIINVAQDVDEDWVLEVYGHDGNAHNISMQPGDLVLYESHSIIHGRPFPLKGRYYANIFIHFEPLGPINATEMPDPSYPPYLVRGSAWEAEWRRINPGGWSALSDINSLVKRNETVALEYVAQVNASRLEETDAQGWAPVHEAAMQGNVEIMKFLYENGANINKLSSAGVSPLLVAENILGKDHAVTHFLRSVGATAPPIHISDPDHAGDAEVEEL